MKEIGIPTHNRLFSSHPIHIRQSVNCKYIGANFNADFVSLLLIATSKILALFTSLISLFFMLTFKLVLYLLYFGNMW
jgi:hypothetical protein